MTSYFLLPLQSYLSHLERKPNLNILECPVLFLESSFLDHCELIRDTEVITPGMSSRKRSLKMSLVNWGATESRLGGP